MLFGDRREQRRLAAGQEHYGDAGFLGHRPEPVRGSVAQPFGDRRLKEKPRAEQRWLRAQRRDALAFGGIVELHARHRGEAAGIAARCFLSVVEACAFERWRHDHRFVDAAFIHQRHDAFDGHRLRQLRRGARRPRTLGRIGFPEMDLRIDDHASCRRRLGAGDVGRSEHGGGAHGAGLE